VTLNCWKNGEKKRRIGKKEYNYLLKVRAFGRTLKSGVGSSLY